MRMNRVKWTIALATVAIAFFAAGCSLRSDKKRGFQDAGVNQNSANQDVGRANPGQNNQKVNLINFSNDFPNIEMKCNGPDGIYANDRSGGYFVVVTNDPQCR